MPQARSLGPLYGHVTGIVDGAPVVHMAWTEEIEEPFRRGHALVLKLPWSHRHDWGNWSVWMANAVVLGLWFRRRRVSEDEALLSAISGGTLDDISIEVISSW